MNMPYHLLISLGFAGRLLLCCYYRSSSHLAQSSLLPPTKICYSGIWLGCLCSVPDVENESRFNEKRF